MLTSVKKRIDRDDEGFTLIELMVVLLIIAILLAIAIPTFLGARNTANARSTQENLRNALTAEQSYWTSNQNFANSLTTIEGALNWTTGTITSEGGNTVATALYNTSPGAAPAAATGTSADSVLIYGYAKDGNCYGIFTSDNSGASFTSYAYWTTTSGCSAPAVANLPQGAAPGAGTSAGSTKAAATPVWDASF